MQESDTDNRTGSDEDEQGDIRHLPPRGPQTGFEALALAMRWLRAKQGDGGVHGGGGRQAAHLALLLAGAGSGT